MPVWTVSYTAAETDSYARAAKMTTQWGAPIAAATVHKHAQQMGPAATTQTQAREDQLMNAATPAQAVAPLPNGLKVFCLVVMMDGFMARERGKEWALKPPETAGVRVAWQEVKVATICRVDQVAQKESGRRQMEDKTNFYFFRQQLNQPLRPRHQRINLRRLPGQKRGDGGLVVKASTLRPPSQTRRVCGHDNAGKTPRPAPAAIGCVTGLCACQPECSAKRRNWQVHPATAGVRQARSMTKSVIRAPIGSCRRRCKESLISLFRISCGVGSRPRV